MLDRAAPLAVADSQPRPHSWLAQYRRRKAAAKRFGTIYDLPLAKRARDVLFQELADGSSVLEVGAGERRMAEHFSRLRPRSRYESLDIDPSGEHDYRSLDEVDAFYDCVFAFEVIEHLSLDEIKVWLRQLADLLAPGGRLVLSTPNTFHPPAWLRDATHQTPLCYDELAGLVEAAGLTVTRIARIHHDPLLRTLLRRFAFGWLFRLLGIDYARQIVLVGERGRKG